MSSGKATTLRLFLSSPSDVLPERNRAEAVVRRVSATLADIDLQLVRWEDGYYTALQSFQDQIDKPSDCDLVVCLFWSRLGSELPPLFNRQDGSGRTGTEWEFEEAMDAARRRDPAVPDLLVYRKTTEPTFKASAAELGLAQKRALDAFWLRWFHDENGHFVAGFDVFADADEFAAKFEKHLREWLRRRTDGVTWDIASKGSPFRGLEPFDEEHASVFFGRATLVRRLAARLQSAAAGGFPLVFVLGASGSGKSSLVRAGLIPYLRTPGVTSPLVARWRRLITTPDALARLGNGDPLAGLAALLLEDTTLPELAHGDFADAKKLAALFSASPDSATVSVLGALERWAEDLRRTEGFAQRPVTGLILVLDQFEEIFKQEDAESTALASAVQAMVDSGRIWVILTLRSDFYQSLQGARPWLALRERGRSFDVTAPGAADIRDIIVAPARAVGLTYEESGGRSLAEELERESLAPGVLPMLQSALEELFKQRDVDSGFMTLASYDRLGGVQGVLAERAERAFAEVDTQAQAALSELLGKLADVDVEAGHETLVARAAQLMDFGSGTPARRLADHLLTARLLLPVSDRPASDENDEEHVPSGHVRVAHESLFLRWPRAQQQLSADRKDLELRRRLNSDATIFRNAMTRESQAARTLLLDGLRLAEGRDLLVRRSDLLSAEAREFISDSDRAATTRSRFVWAMALSLTLLFGLVATFAGWSALDATRQKEAAQANLELATDRALGRAGQAVETADMRSTRAFLTESLSYAARPASLMAAAIALQQTAAAPAGVPLWHDTAVRSAEFSPDGLLIVTMSDDNAARIWDARTRTIQGSLLRHDGPVTSASFSRDSRRIITTSADKTARLWDAATGLPAGKPLQHFNKVKSAQFSLDGTRIVTVCVETAQLWDAGTGARIGDVLRHDKNIYSADFSPDGTRVVTASADTTARVWDATNGTPVTAPLQHEGVVMFAEFSPDSQHIVTACLEKCHAAYLWDAATGIQIGSPMKHENWVWQARFSPDGTRIVTASWDKKARQWNAETGAPIGAPMSHDASVQSVAFSADGMRIVTRSSDNIARVWNARTGYRIGEPLRHEDYVSTVHFSPDGRYILTASSDKSARIWDVRAAAPVGAPLRHKDRVISAQFSADGTRIVTASADKTAEIWNADTGAPLIGPLQHDDAVTLARFSSSSALVVTASRDKTARIWDGRTGKPVGEILRHPGAVWFPRFSPDETRILTTSEKAAYLWDARTGELLRGPLQHEAVTSAVFSPDGSRIVTVGEDNAARMWDTYTGAPVNAPMRHEGRVKSAQFNREATLLVTAAWDKTARIWNVATGMPAGEPLRHKADVNLALFSPDGTLIVTTEEKAAHIWDVRTRAQVGSALQHYDSVMDAQFSADGTRIVTAGWDTTARVWDATTGFLLGEYMDHIGWVGSAQFSPDGARITTSGWENAARTWDAYPYLGGRRRLTEAWRAISGMEVSQNGRVQRLPVDEILSSRSLLLRPRTQKEQQQADLDDAETRQILSGAKVNIPKLDQDSLARVIAWHMADRGTREISPFSKIRTVQFIDDAIASALTELPPQTDEPGRIRRQAILLEAYDLDPGHPLILAALSMFEAQPDTQRLWRRLTIERIAGQTEWAARAALIFQQAGDRESARAAVEIALARDSRDTTAQAVLQWTLQ